MVIPVRPGIPSLQNPESRYPISNSEKAMREERRDLPILKINISGFPTLQTILFSGSRSAISIGAESSLGSPKLSILQYLIKFFNHIFSTTIFDKILTNKLKRRRNL